MMLWANLIGDTAGCSSFFTQLSSYKRETSMQVMKCLPFVLLHAQIMQKSRPFANFDETEQCT
jgi:hypothetical protein